MQYARVTAVAAVVGAGLSFATALFAADASFEPQTQGSVSFVSGGVGLDESERMKQLASQYPLELLFVSKGNPNQYLNDVKVQIKDSAGKVVLDTTSRGPFLLAKLAPGRYTISAESEAGAKRQSVQVGTKKQRVMFMWPTTGETAGPKTGS